MNFGQKILEFRAKYDLTQQQVSVLLGVSRDMVYRYETGKGNPSRKNIIKYENIMNEYEVNKNV
jgi:transcriptional regulator with XRE-family HTH domain